MEKYKVTKLNHDFFFAPIRELMLWRCVSTCGSTVKIQSPGYAAFISHCQNTYHPTNHCWIGEMYCVEHSMWNKSWTLIKSSRRHSGFIWLLHRRLLPVCASYWPAAIFTDSAETLLTLQQPDPLADCETCPHSFFFFSPSSYFFCSRSVSRQHTNRDNVFTCLGWWGRAGWIPHLCVSFTAYWYAQCAFNTSLLRPGFLKMGQSRRNKRDHLWTAVRKSDRSETFSLVSSIFTEVTKLSRLRETKEAKQRSNWTMGPTGFPRVSVCLIANIYYSHTKKRPWAAQRSIYFSIQSISLLWWRKLHGTWWK